MNKNITQILLNTLIGIALIYLWGRIVPVGEVVEKLGQTNVWNLVVCILLLTFGGVLRGARLWVLLPKGEISLKNSVFITLLSQCLSFIIPLRLGEVTKSLYLATQSKKITFSKAIIWVFLDRFIDFWTVILLVCLLIPFSPISFPASLKQVIFVSATVLTAGLSLTIYYPNLILKIVTTVLKIVYPINLREIITKFVNFIFSTLEIIPKDTSRQLVLLALTFLSWILEAVVWLILLREVGIIDPSFIIIFVGTLLLVLSFLIPSAPGYVGTLQAAGVVIFSYLFGYDEISVSAAAVLFNIVMLIGSLVPGVISIYVLDIKLKNLWTNKPITR